MQKNNILYFIKRNEKISGPFSRKQLQSGIDSGKLKSNDIASNDKNGPWLVVDTILNEPVDLAELANSNLIPASSDEPGPPLAVEMQEQKAASNPNLIPCPDCYAQVSKRAINCPHCGSPMTEPEILGDPFLSGATDPLTNPQQQFPQQQFPQQQFPQQQFPQQQFPQQQFPQQQFPQQQFPQGKKTVEEESQKASKLPALFLLGGPFGLMLKGVIDRYSPQIACSGFLFVMAICGVIYCLVFADTSVSTGMGMRVNNIGLMQQNQNLLMVFGFAAVGSGAWLGFEIYRWQNSERS